MPKVNDPAPRPIPATQPKPPSITAPKQEKASKPPTPPALKPIAPVGPRQTGVAEAKQPLPYPDLEFHGYFVGDFVVCGQRFQGKGGITEELAKKLLRWQTEKDAIAERIQGDASLKAEDIGWEDFLLEDFEGNKVRCYANQHNRPLDKDTSLKYAQDILTGNWAGPTSFPGETVNGETVVIGRHGNVISGQHRLIGIILAAQLWRKQAGKEGKWGGLWPEPPILETLVITGASEAPNIVRTIDNVKPRDLADVIFTSPVFDDLPDRKDKLECSRMTKKAVDLLWRRVDASHAVGQQKTLIYQTHSQSQDFIARHGGDKGHLIQSVRHLFECNKDRVVSALRLSPGQCAAINYLQGSSSSNIDDYIHGGQKEDNLAWDNWDTAKAFWLEIAKGKESQLEAIFDALSNLVDEDEGGTGRLSEKLVVLSRAWEHYLKDEPVVITDIALNSDKDYGEDQKGNSKLIAVSNFGGIDLGSKPELKGETDKETIERDKIEERKVKQGAKKEENKREKQMAEKLEKMRSEKSPKLQELDKTRSRVEQEQTQRAADADFLKMWTDWAGAGKLIGVGTAVYKQEFTEWSTSGRPDVQQFLAEVVRSGRAKPIATATKPPMVKK